MATAKKKAAPKATTRRKTVARKGGPTKSRGKGG